MTDHTNEYDQIAARAIDDAADVLDNPATLPDLDLHTVTQVIRWLRERADDLRLSPGVPRGSDG